MKHPDLTGFVHHSTVEDIDLEGEMVPGLRASFFRRLSAAGTETVGVYAFAGREAFMAWGYVGEEHCRYHAMHGVGGTWEAAQAGCPRVRVLRDGSTVVGLAMRSVSGDWLVLGVPARVPISA